MGRTAHGEYAGRGRGEVGASPRVCRAWAAGVKEEAGTNDAGEGIRRGSSPARPSGGGEVEIRRGIPRNGGVQGDGVGEPADDGARGDDGVRSGRRRGAQGGPTRWRLVAAGTGDAGEACGGDGRGSGWFGPDPIWIGMGSEWGVEWVTGWLGFRGLTGGGIRREWGGRGLVGGPVGPVVSWAEAQGGFSSSFSFWFSVFLSFCFFSFCFAFSFYFTFLFYV